MAVSILSVVFVTTSGGTVTVPTGAQGVVAFHTHYAGVVGSSLNTISLGGASSFTIAQDIGVSASNSSAQSVSYATISSTGSQTFSFSLDHAASEGPIFCLVFVDGINTSDWIRQTAAQAQPGTTNPSGTVNSSTTDKVLGFNQKFNAIPATVTGWTSQATQAVTNSEAARLNTADSPGATTTTFTATNSDFSSVGVVSIKEGSSGVSGTIAITESADTVVASGTTTVTGTIAVTETADTVAASGTTTVTGTIAISENADTIAASGSVGSAVEGTASIQENPDTVAASGTTTVLGTVAITEGADTITAQGTTTILGTVTIQENADTVAASGSVGSEVFGTVSINENADIVAATGTTTVLGSAAIQENSDVISAAGTTTVLGSIAITENQDTVLAIGTSGTPAVGSNFWRFLGLFLGKLGV